MIRSIKWLAPFLRLFDPHRWWMLLGSLCGLTTVVCGVGLLALSGWFISATAFAGLTVAAAHLFNFFYPSIGVRLFAVGRTASRYAERIVTHDTTFRILETLRRWFYQKLEPLAPAGLSAFRSGDVLNRIVADIDALDNLYLRVLSPSGVALVTAVLVGCFLLIFDPVISLSTMFFLCAAGFGVPLFAARAGNSAGTELARQTAYLRTQIIEGLQGMAELLVFGAGHRHQEQVLESHRALVKSQLRMSHIRGVCGALITALSGGAVIVTLVVGVDRVAAGALDGANLALVGLAVLACFEAVAPLPMAFQYLGQTREAGRRLLEIVAVPLPVSFPKKSKFRPAGFDLAFDQVAFRYAPNRPIVLEDLNLEIPHGQRVAVLGETGAGKSTLVNLLVRFWDPHRGRILLGGRDIRTFAEKDLRRLISVLSQQAHMFSATVRNNLLIARPDAGEEELWAALEGAELHDFIYGLPMGLDTWVGEGGKLLSGGQSRRLAVARAILKDAPIWVLDEPTEGLDRVTEQAMMKAIFERAGGRTVLMITHRPAMLEQMDRIIILEKGRVAASGTHQSLLVESPHYAVYHQDMLLDK